MNKLLSSISIISIFLFCSAIYKSTSAQTTRNQTDNSVKTILFNKEARPSLYNKQQTLEKLLELGKNQRLVLNFSNAQQNGSVIERYTLHYKNFAVEHGSAAAMLVDDKLAFIHANIFPESSIVKDSKLMTENEALKLALQEIGADEYMWEGAAPSKIAKDNPSYQSPVGELVWVEDFGADKYDERKLYLAYKFDIYAKKPISRDLIYVHAATGKILLKDPVMKHVAGTGASVYSDTVSFNIAKVGGSTFEMFDSMRKSGTYDLAGGTNPGFASIITGSSSFFTKSVAVDAHWGAIKVYDYWKNKHNRTSYDNFGSELYSCVNFGISINNAYWDGSVMLYGNGTGMFTGTFAFDPLTTLDICGHEIGHGVCQYTSNLVYNKESGALNEGFSDIWGAMIEHYAAPDKDMWSIGEEIGKSPLRTMNNPNVLDYPDTYDGTHWIDVVNCTPPANDNCGVHTNSSVLNYWFYLLTEGGKGTNDNNDNYELVGIGADAAAEIAYATEQVISSTATFAECRTASINYTKATFGNCSREVEAVTRAWYAVGVGTVFVPCAPQVGFSIADTTINRSIAGFNCPSVQAVSIPLRVLGNAPTGGNATITVSAQGSAKANEDYTIPANVLTFNAGSTVSQMLQVNIFDNGNVSDNKEVKLYFTITQNGSDLTTSYTYDTCVVKIIGNKMQPDTGAVITNTVSKLNVKSKSITPFFSGFKAARSYFIVTATELVEAGVRPNVPISSIQLNVTEKNSTQAFSNFEVKMGATSQSDLTGGISTLSTTYYSGSFTTQKGWNTIPLSTPFVWNGTDNIAIETCFTNNTSDAENDYVEGVVTKNIITAIAYSTFSSNGCSLPFTSGNGYFGIAKPIVRMQQTTTAVEAEQIVVSSRQWDVMPAQEVYFTNDTTGRLIAGVLNADKELGCTKAEVIKSGAGFVSLPSPFATVGRSQKEFSLSVTKNASSSYDMYLYFDTSEYTTTANVRVVATSAAHDSLMDTSNTRIVIPVVEKTSNTYKFKAAFTGVQQRYFLIDDNITLPPPQSVHALHKQSGSIRVINNPFTDKIMLSYVSSNGEKATILLYDITGKNVLQTEEYLSAGKGIVEINTANELILQGNYVLKVITNNEVLTYKMVKQ